MHKTLLIILCITLLASCKTRYVTIEKEVPIEKIKVEYNTSTKYDSIYIHDSINVYAKNDTVFKDKIKVVYKERFFTDTICKIDSIEKPVYINKTEVVEVNKPSKFQKLLMYSGGLLWAGLIVLIIRYIIKLKRKLSVL